MIITLIGQEKNVGILTLSYYLLEKLGKANAEIAGWSYLVTDYTSTLEKISNLRKEKSVIVKYVIPKIRFSNQSVSYPKELEEISDIVFRIPSYLEEIASQPILTFFKGGENPFSKKITDFYLTTIS